MRSEWLVTFLCCGDSGIGVKSPRFGGAFFYIDADALYALKSRGFGGEIGLVLVRKNKKVPRGRHGSPTDDDSDQSSSEGGGLAGQCA